MINEERCEICDRPMGSDSLAADLQARGAPEAEGAVYCWGAYGEAQCREAAVDWRARALKAEARTATLEAELWVHRTNDLMVCEREPCDSCCACATADAYGGAVSVEDYPRRDEIEERVSLRLGRALSEGKP